ncbi:MAG: hypothetical protein ACHQZS_01235 [Candidatus Binatales bacterium]
MKALKPQDVVVLLKLLEGGRTRPTYAQLASHLFMSQSEVHASIQRAKASRLVHHTALGDRPNVRALEEFLVHGVKYAFPPERGGITRGVPTGSAAEPLNREITQEEPVPVWPFEEGPRRGYAFSPLHKSVPRAAMKDPKLYELLALVDAIRDGGARERDLAQRALSSRLRAVA